MSLEATHIRFALDVIGKYEIKDMAQYLSGAVYPDSRYVAKIERELTHNPSVLEASFADTDFKKGWQSHFLCDVIYDKVKRTVLPELTFLDSGGRDDWILSTALKLVQDIDDMPRFNLQGCLPALDFAANPNGEDLAKIMRYNQAVRELYLDKRACKIDDYRKVFDVFGIGRESIAKIIEQAKALNDDQEILARIRSIYSLMVAEALA
ncbi:hypothetical protein HGA34_05220 [Candidatus Falkowbacteria bacterium]|nr:hypothetical protein [Candidatus Falkowbacteria bacterium]